METKEIYDQIWALRDLIIESTIKDAASVDVDVEEYIRSEAANADKEKVCDHIHDILLDSIGS